VEEDGESVEDSATEEDAKNEQMGEDGNVGPATGIRGDGKPFKLQQSGWSRRYFDLRAVKRVNFNSCLVSECVLCAFIL